MNLYHLRCLSLSVAAAAMLSPGLVAANRFVQHNLISDVPGLADQTDPNLVNPWGIATSPASPFWVVNNHTGTVTVYNTTGQPFPVDTPIVVSVPAPPNGTPPGAPTGQVFNDSAAFVLPNGTPALFLFATEDGTIAGWNPSAGGNAVLTFDNSSSGAVYKGLAIGANSSGPMLYAANFHAGSIDVLDSGFSLVATAGGFSDPSIPAGFSPFNVQRIGRRLFVTYAKQDDQAHDDVAGPGNGFVNMFDMDGNLVQRVASSGNLNSPWGLAMAPENFGDFSHTLLVGNFGDGSINAFDPCSGEFLGTLNDTAGNPIMVPGLWGLLFGNGKNGGDAATLYFTAGIPGDGESEDHGLFGSLQPGSPLAPPSPTMADIANFAFSPQPISISAGTQVIWTNGDSAAHTVFADDGAFSSKPLLINQNFTFQFSQPGTYSYHCSIHPFMKGTVLVK